MWLNRKEGAARVQRDKRGTRFPPPQPASVHVCVHAQASGERQQGVGRTVASVLMFTLAKWKLAPLEPTSQELRAHFAMSSSLSREARNLAFYIEPRNFCKTL